EAGGTTSAYVFEGGDDLLSRFAPIFVVEHDEESFNKIGTPTATLRENGREKVRVDPSHPSIYTQVVPFATEKGQYTNLIYRIHFERSPASLIPLNVAAGKNMGAMAVITLNNEEKPVWLTTVQSCGCYHAIMPTDYLPEDAYPAGWNKDGFTVYGEQMPGVLGLKEKSDSDGRIVISIRSESHRCMGVAVRSESDVAADFPVIATPRADMEALKHLPLPDGGETSFYHTKGHRRGLVKGAWKPLETALFGLWSWDHNVGQDREYGAKEAVGHRFYTTLFFKRKKPSDMWDFAGYLRHNGWKP
ncbi:MAG: hypothetical protein L3K26_14025, partial [Candidatus Hydrogenedentes bacterium]|nr:hypothetical protein [Candidatus Hydrogenedentota bacterium]